MIEYQVSAEVLEDFHFLLQGNDGGWFISRFDSCSPFCWSMSRYDDHSVAIKSVSRVKLLAGITVGILSRRASA